ncbi:hypothetical protein [Streptococcus saliviloxodontae]|uniref:DUF5648 domain-containing protein n=1 Tax=Streptococcus saliviloxodontae TaxID=1349416 RepID=A0ABS2PNZ3_9STRE|nr:hypothetical protein [Streptococcus saliviloxodontae]MBM7636681.1 hypothetical protein [Streptococcus saliviloxodontae]
MKKKWLRFGIVGAVLATALVATNDVKADTAIYRLYNPSLKEHLFTADQNEYNVLASRGWSQEGQSWIAPDEGVAVTRLYSKITHKHLYTTDANEIMVLTASGAWTQDAMSFYSGGSIPIYRLYHAGIQTHLLTADTNEYSVLSGAWNPEGIKLYAKLLPGQSTQTVNPFLVGTWTNDLGQSLTVSADGSVVDSYSGATAQVTVKSVSQSGVIEGGVSSGYGIYAIPANVTDPVYSSVDSRDRIIAGQGVQASVADAHPYYRN